MLLQDILTTLVGGNLRVKVKSRISPPRPNIESQMGLNPYYHCIFPLFPLSKNYPTLKRRQDEFSHHLVTNLCKSYLFIWMTDQTEEKKEEVWV